MQWLLQTMDVHQVKTESMHDLNHIYPIKYLSLQSNFATKTALSKSMSYLLNSSWLYVQFHDNQCLQFNSRFSDMNNYNNEVGKFCVSQIE